MTDQARRLIGCRVVVTRTQPGELGELLDAEGADVVHLPLIETVDAADDGAALDEAIRRLEPGDWLVVTSPNGAERVGAVADRPEIRLAAVGSRTATALETATGRTPDVQPRRQTAADLADTLIEHLGGASARFVLALGDLAATTLADALAQAGHHVETVVAYRTVPVESAAPDAPVADALLLASGSAAEAWCAAFGTTTPPTVIAIGPTTAAAAEAAGLKITSVAADHSMNGLVDELRRTVGPNDARPGTRHR